MIASCLRRYAALAGCALALVASRDSLGAVQTQLTRVSDYLVARAGAGDARR